MWVKEEVPLNVPEQWRRYDDVYWVSDQGRVKRIYKNGSISYLTPRLRGDKNKKCDSLRVKLYGRYVTLNKLIWETFRGKIPEGYTVVNKYGYSTMNDVYSLELISLKKINKFSRRPTSKPVIDLKSGWVYPSCRDLARRLNTNHQTVRNWCQHKYKNDSKRFEFYDETRKYPMILKFAREGVTRHVKNGRVD